MTFSRCDIPVLFLNCEFWSGCEGSPKISFKIQRLEEEATQSKCNGDRIRSGEFLLRTEVLTGKLSSDVHKRNLQKTKTRWRLSVCCWVSSCFVLFIWFVTWLKPETQEKGVSDGPGAALCAWREMSGQPVQQTTTTATPRSWQEQRDNPIQAEGRGGVWEGQVGKGQGGVMWPQSVHTDLCRRRNAMRKRLWQNTLKALLGDDWLIAPPLPFPVTHTEQVHSFTDTTIFTLHWS